MIKKIVSIFLLALMCTQLLPIKEMGKLLFNNQIVEEHPSDGGCGNDIIKLAKELKYCKQYDGALKFAPELFLNIIQYHLLEDIPNGPAQEVKTPPPNYC
ncbi:hypothetical protein CK934_05005 [Chitinophaga sp. MD30]|nr:hypothetical protein CK934_05005 [Chitinophaga sp. MD30]